MALPFGGSQAKKIVDTGLLYGLNEGVEYSIDKEGGKKVKFAEDVTPTRVTQSAMFGKWSAPTAQEYIENNFKGLTKSQTKGFEMLKKQGFSNSEAFATMKSTKVADKNGNNTTTIDEAIEYLNSKDYTRQQKALLFACMCPDTKRKPFGEY